MGFINNGGSNGVSKTYVDTKFNEAVKKAAEAAAENAETTSEHVGDKYNPHEVGAGQVAFEDGETFQEKYDSGELVGDDGTNGKSAYEIGVDNGFEGTEAEWLESLRGIDGTDNIATIYDILDTNGGDVTLRNISTSRGLFNTLSTAYRSYRISFSSDSKYLGIASYTTPNVIVWRIDDDFERLTRMSLPSAQTGTSRLAEFSPDAKFFIHGTFQTPIRLWEIVDEAFVYRGNSGSGNGSRCGAFLPQSVLPGGIKAVFISMVDTTPFLQAASLNDDNSFTKLDIDVQPNGGASGDYIGDIAVHPNGRFIAVVHQKTPFLTLYEVVTTDATVSFRRLSDVITVTPTGDGRGCAFSPDGTLLIVGHLTDPYITSYVVTFDDNDMIVLDKLPDLPEDIRTISPRKIAFHPGGGSFIISNALTAYTISSVTFRQSAKIPVADINGYDIAFHPSGRIVGVVGDTKPLAAFYDVTTDLNDTIENNFEMRLMRKKLSELENKLDNLITGG